MAAAFDSVAARYDELWTRSNVGRLQRGAVWRAVDGLWRPGQAILDLGCGTGEDALHFMGAGVRVQAIDASEEMVRVSRARGADAMRVAIEEIASLAGPFDGAISNFGALNCIADLRGIREPLAELLRPGAYFAACTIGRFCLWETAWYLLHASPGKAFRRWRGSAASKSLGVRVYYHSIRELERALAPQFALRAWRGIGGLVPPSYVSLPAPLLEAFDSIDRQVAGWPLGRAMADHRLAIFVRT